MKGFLVKLSDEHRDKLETIRRQRGDRSQSDTVRGLIENFGHGTYIARIAEPDDPRWADEKPSSVPAAQIIRDALAPLRMPSRAPGSLLKKPKAAK